MWITEIHNCETGALIGRYTHGSSYNVAMDSHNSIMFRYAAHRVHLIWED